MNYPGVSIRGERILIRFVWPKGSRKQVRVSLPKNIKINERNLKYAYGLVNTIKNEVDLGTFSWRKHFPDHKYAKTELQAKEGYLVNQLLNDYLDYAKSRREGITLDNYTYRVKQILQPQFGSIPVNQLRTTHLTEWAVKLGSRHITTVTLKSYIAPLRSAFKWARSVGRLSNNPFDGFSWPEETKAVKKKRLEKRKQKKLDVFSPDEINQLIKSCRREQEANLFLFGFWSGLRPEELFALHWDDVDLNNQQVFVHRAKIYRRGFKVIDYTVDSVEELKGVKTGELGERHVVLLPQALKALNQQEQFTYDTSDFVFHNQHWNKPWTNTNQLANRFRECCIEAGIRYRRPYMMRHTYASLLLKHGEDESWVANQMGHVDTTMLRTVYRDFIPDKGYGYALKNDWSAAEFCPV